MLEPGEEAKVDILVTIPFEYVIEDQEVIFQVGATSELGHESELTLEIEFFRPDLKITGVTYEPMNITKNVTVTFDVVVSNLDVYDIPEVDINLYGNEVLIDTVMIQTLPTGMNKTVNLTWLPDTIGTQEINIEVVCFNQIQDNHFLNLTVEEEIPDLGISDVEIPAGDVEVNKETKIEISVANEGAVDAENVTVNLYDGDTIVDTVVIKSLPADSNTSIEFDWKPKKKGDNNLRIELEYEDQVTGTGDDDDVVIETVTVKEEQGLKLFGLDIILVVLIIVIIVVVVLVALAALIMKKKGKGATPTGPPPAQQMLPQTQQVAQQYPDPGQPPQQPPQYPQYPVQGQPPQQQPPIPPQGPPV
jgi:hypothetical protein